MSDTNFSREESLSLQPCETAASLAVALSFIEIPVEPKYIAHKFAPNGELTAYQTVRAAKKMGAKARLTSATLESLPKLPLPALLQRKSGDFFVLLSLKEDKALVYYPNKADNVVSCETLCEDWSGEVILLSKTSKIMSEAEIYGMKWVFKVAWKYRLLVGEILLISYIVQSLGLASPIFFQLVIDKVFANQSLTTLNVLSLGLLAISIFEVCFGWLRSYILMRTSAKIDVELGANLFEHLSNLPLRYFETRPAGVTVARVREMDTIRQFLSNSTITIFVDSIFTVIFFVALYMYSPTLFWVPFAAVPIFILVAFSISPILRKRLNKKFELGAQNQAFITETVYGIETVKSMNVEPRFNKRWEDYIAQYARCGFKADIVGTTGGQLIQFVSKLVTVGILWIGATLVIEGSLTVGQLIAFNMIAGQVTAPLIRLSQLWEEYQQTRVAIARISDILKTSREPYYSNTQVYPEHISGSVSFQKVVFRYDPGGPENIKSLSLVIPAGQVIGIAGRSGSGKSTLGKLIQRLYIPESGKILIDDMDVSQLDPQWVRSQIGVVLQENIMFKDSIRNNIALHNPSLDSDSIIRAATTAGAHGFITNLPQGYDTLLEERGGNLSGGQRQRLALARALASNPRILVLDEATSALDYESERLINEQMHEICRDKTVIIIAHRLSTLRVANRIILMDDGHIVEDGSYQELIDKKGAFFDLVEEH